MAEKVPGWLQRILLPQINELKGDIRVLATRIDGLDQKLDASVKGIHEKFDAKIDDVDGRLTSKIDGLDGRLTSKIDSVEGKLTSRIDSVEGRLTSRIYGLESRMESEFSLVHTELKRVDDRIDSLDKRTDMTQRLAVVEEQLKELRAKA